MNDNYKIIIDNINKYTSYDYDDFYDELNKLEQVKVDDIQDSFERKQLLLAYHLTINEFHDNNFTYNSFGKPLLNDVYFNFSYDENIVVLVVSSKEVGIDIEKIRTIPLANIKTFTTPSELRKIQKADKINEMAFTYYVLKQAHLKMLGDDKRKYGKEIEFKISRNKITSNKGNYVYKIKKYHSYIIGICIDFK